MRKTSHSILPVWNLEVEMNLIEQEHYGIVFSLYGAQQIATTVLINPFFIHDQQSFECS